MDILKVYNMMLFYMCFKGRIDWNCPSWPRTILTIYISYFMTGGPGKEYGTNEPPRSRIQELGRVKRRHNVSYQLPRILLAGIHLGWAMRTPPRRKDPEQEWPARDNLKTHPIMIKLKTVNQVAEQSSWVPLPCWSLLGCPFPKKSLFC